jgi:hypothetical protein
MKVPAIFLFLLAVAHIGEHHQTSAYTPMGIITKRSTMTMKRGRGSFQKEIGGGASSSSSSSSSSFSSGMPAAGRNWLNTNKSIKELPETEGKVSLFVGKE